MTHFFFQTPPRPECNCVGCYVNSICVRELKRTIAEDMDKRRGR